MPKSLEQRLRQVEELLAHVTSTDIDHLKDLPRSEIVRLVSEAIITDLQAFKDRPPARQAKVVGQSLEEASEVKDHKDDAEPGHR